MRLDGRTPVAARLGRRSSQGRGGAPRLRVGGRRPGIAAVFGCGCPPPGCRSTTSRSGAPAWGAPSRRAALPIAPPPGGGKRPSDPTAAPPPCPRPGGRRAVSGPHRGPTQASGQALHPGMPRVARRDVGMWSLREAGRPLRGLGAQPPEHTPAPRSLQACLCRRPARGRPPASAACDDRGTPSAPGRPGQAARRCRSSTREPPARGMVAPLARPAPGRWSAAGGQRRCRARRGTVEAPAVGSRIGHPVMTRFSASVLRTRTVRRSYAQVADVDLRPVDLALVAISTARRMSVFVTTCRVRIRCSSTPLAMAAADLVLTRGGPGSAPRSASACRPSLPGPLPAPQQRHARPEDDGRLDG
jgi:hypothetical protein